MYIYTLVISVGENSYLIASNIVIENSFIGLAIKDESDVLVDRIELKNNDYGIVSYIKKREYGSSQGKITNFIFQNNNKNIFLEEGSEFFINKNYVEKKYSNIFEKIYESYDNR